MTLLIQREILADDYRRAMLRGDRAGAKVIHARMKAILAEILGAKNG